MALQAGHAISRHGASGGALPVESLRTDDVSVHALRDVGLGLYEGELLSHVVQGTRRC